MGAPPSRTGLQEEWWPLCPQQGDRCVPPPVALPPRLCPRSPAWRCQPWRSARPWQVPAGTGWPRPRGGVRADPVGAFGDGGGQAPMQRSTVRVCARGCECANTGGAAQVAASIFPPPLGYCSAPPHPQEPTWGGSEKDPGPPLQRGHPKWLHSAAEPQVLPMPGQVYKGGGAPPPSHPPHGAAGGKIKA